MMGNSELIETLFENYRILPAATEKALERLGGNHELVIQAAMLADFSGISMSEGVEDVIRAYGEQT